MFFRGKKNNNKNDNDNKLKNTTKPTITRMDPRDVSWMRIDLLRNPSA